MRHGTTRANLEGRLQGTLPFPLGPEGKKEVLCLAKRLYNQTFSAFFCSSGLRARQTARLLARAVKAPPPLYTPLLEEYYWGIVQGMTRREIAERYPILFRQMQRDFQHAAIPGAEGMKKLLQRVARFNQLLAHLEQIRKYQDPVLVVSHGRFLQAFIQYFLAYDGSKGWPFSLSPASLTILQGDFRGQRRLRLFNDTCHLKNSVYRTQNSEVR